MKSETGNLLRLMKTNLRISSAVMICITTYIITPKIAETSEQLNILTIKSIDNSSNEQLAIIPKAKIQRLKNIYVPPNYGGPDSRYGSGTR